MAMCGQQYSCNNNQNHLVANGRSTSRVLQPPGGASSFSLGGNYGGDYSTSSNGPQTRKPLSSMDNKPAYSQAPSMKRDQMPVTKNQSMRRDSLDDLMGGGGNGRGTNKASGGFNIPGLESHYGGPKSHSPPNYSRNDGNSRGRDGPSQRDSRSRDALDEQEYHYRQQAPTVQQSSRSNGHTGPMGSSDYAALLKAQISQKTQMTKAEKYRQDRYDEENGSSNKYQNDSQVSTGRRGAGGAGASTLQLGDGHNAKEEPRQRQRDQQRPPMQQQQNTLQNTGKRATGGQSSFSIGWD